MKELYILGDFNINKCQNNKYIVREYNTISSNFLSSSIKYYHQFCAMHGLKHLIEFVTCSTSTQIDHILASFPSNKILAGVTDVGISDHQLIFCTQKIFRLKTGGIQTSVHLRTILSIIIKRLLNNYSFQTTKRLVTLMRPISISFRK